MPFHGVSWFLSLKHLLKFHVIYMISWSLLRCHYISIYRIEMLQWYLNIYWHEDSWFNIEKTVHDMVALQEWYRIMIDDIQKNWLICGKCLCEATNTILWYIVYMGSWVLRWKSLKPSRKTLQCGCMGLVLSLGFSP